MAPKTDNTSATRYPQNLDKKTLMYNSKTEADLVNWNTESQPVPLNLRKTSKEHFHSRVAWLVLKVNRSFVAFCD